MSTSTPPAAEAAPEEWPSPDFLNTAMRLRVELEKAIQHEQTVTRRVADIQNAAFAKGLPVAVVSGGKEELAKLSEEKRVATIEVSQKRDALRQFQVSERAKFFALRDQEYERLYPEIRERFARAQAAAAELHAAVADLLGAEAQAQREEILIRAWNREVRKFNRSLSFENVNGITAFAGISIGECVRGRIDGLLLQDANLREFCRDLLLREAQRRERAAEIEEQKIAQREAAAAPINYEKPF